jgi:F0F1-type ATP synthase assembly protein I
MAALISKDHKDYQEPTDRAHWTNRKGAPITLSTAAGGVGVVGGLVLGWLTTINEAPAVLIGGLIGILGFDFYWRWVKDTLPGRP